MLLGLVAAAFMFFLAKLDKSNDREAENTMRMELVGEYVELNGDTLEIMKYHILHKEYVLEDGHRASPAMVAVLLIR